MPRNPLDLGRVIECLKTHDVEFIVVGGIVAVLYGVAHLTYDLDIVPARTPENAQRLENALRELGAYYREHEEWKPAPEAKLLLGSGHHLLNTSDGPVDVLGEITGGRDYTQLLPETVELPIGNNLFVRVVTLEMLIRLKEEMGRDRDLLLLPLLRALVEERQAHRPEGSIKEGTTGGA